jgi:hypothetical protein
VIRTPDGFLGPHLLSGQAPRLIRTSSVKGNVASFWIRNLYVDWLP